MSIVLFCITFAIPHILQVPESSTVSDASSFTVDTTERHASSHVGMGYAWMALQVVFPILCLCMFAFSLTDGRMRRLFRLGSLDDDHAPPHQASTSPNTVHDISSTIRHVPIMEYHTREDVRRMSLHDLKTLAQHARLGKYCSQPSSQQLLLVDKEDVIRDILGTDDEENDVCSICQEEYVSKQLIRVLPRCGHRYHVECVDQWFLTSNRAKQRQALCPLCKASV